MNKMNLKIKKMVKILEELEKNIFLKNKDVSANVTLNI